MARERLGELPTTPLGARLAITDEVDRYQSRDAAAREAMHTNAFARSLTMQPVDWNPDALADSVIVELKYDGIPMLFSEGLGVTREAVPFDSTRPKWAALQALERALGEPHAFHGEYICAGGFEATLADFRSGAGKGALMLFDAIPLDAYMGRRRCPPLRQRKAALERQIRGSSTMRDAEIGFVQSMPFEGAARDGIEEVAGIAWDHGHEGLVVKDADSPYVRAASPYWMRIKRTETVDLPILEAHVLDGRLAFVIVEPSPGVRLRVAVGFSERQRAAPADFRVGRMIEIKHLGRTSRGSLRSASFLRFRDDKES